MACPQPVGLFLGTEISILTSLNSRNGRATVNARRFTFIARVVRYDPLTSTDQVGILGHLTFVVRVAVDHRTFTVRVGVYSKGLEDLSPTLRLQTSCNLARWEKPSPK